MKQHKKLTLSALITAGLLAAAPAAFAGNAGTWYLGLGVGSTSSDYSSSKCNSDNGLTDCSVSATGTSYKLLGGYNINSNFAVEGAYGSLGEVKISSAQAGGSAKQTTTDFNIDAVGNYGFGNGWSVSARVGAFTAKSDNKATGGGNSTTISVNSTGLDFGVGGGYDFTKNLTGRLAYQMFDGVGKTASANSNGSPTFKNNISEVSLALVYNY